MQRTWTDKTREEWIGGRAERRRQASRPNPRSPRDDSLEREKGKVYDSLVKLITRTSSWEVHKHPLRAYPAPFSGRLYVPLRYCENDEERTVEFNQGDDLTTLVYRFYNEKPDLSFIGDNYVATDGISPKRYEFLGPAPFVAGFQFNETSKTARIEWWDPYTASHWVGSRKWRVEVYFDEVVEGWVSRPRGDFDSAPDMQYYLGL